MVVAATAALFVGLSPQNKGVVVRYTGPSCSHRAGLPLNRINVQHSISPRFSFPCYSLIISFLGGKVHIHANKIMILSNLEDNVTAASKNISEPRELKIRIDVSGGRTQVIFDDVFSKLVAAAQPIPGFCRLKGKAPDIPRNSLLQILGPSRVNNQEIKKIINIAVSEIVEKEGMNVTSNLKIESYEELEADFVPGKDFSFTAILVFNDITGTNT